MVGLCGPCVSCGSCGSHIDIGARTWIGSSSSMPSISAIQEGTAGATEVDTFAGAFPSLPSSDLDEGTLETTPEPILDRASSRRFAAISFLRDASEPARADTAFLAASLLVTSCSSSSSASIPTSPALVVAASQWLVSSRLESRMAAWTAGKVESPTSVLKTRTRSGLAR